MSAGRSTVAQHASELLSLEGKVVIITGGASGIGRGIALRLAEMGAFVGLLDIDGRKGREVASEIRAGDGRATFLKCDVCKTVECRRAVQAVMRKAGRIDVLCNCAGIIVRKDATKTTEGEWSRVLDITLNGVYRMSRETLPHMIRNGGGSIVNIGSGWSLKGGAAAAAYCAAKGGVLNLTRAMAIDYGKHNIRVNCVCPGDIDTPMLNSECMQLGRNREEFLREAADRPLARVGTPADVSNSVLFLVSPMASWITGAALVVDGGGLA